MVSHSLSLEATYVPHLRNQFAQGRAILFTGAGFSRDAINVKGTRLPSSDELTRELWKICYRDEEFDASTQLQDIYEAALQIARRDTERLMAESLTVDGSRNPGHYAELLSFPWNRIYTLNVDDLIEKTLSEIGGSRSAKSISATTDRISELDERRLCTIHLNGSLRDLPDKVTFGRGQYAIRRSGDPFYETLRHDLLFQPVVFIGTNLEEGPMWQHLAIRDATGGPAAQGLRPRSYLVAPVLNRSKEALLSKYKIVWLQMTTADFATSILSRLGDAKVEGNRLLNLKGTELDRGAPRIQIISEIPEGSPEPTEYLLGAEPTWPDAKHGRIAQRVCLTEIREQVKSLLAASIVRKFLIVTGTAGVGKSSAMMATALQLDADGISTGWVDCTSFFEPAELRHALARYPSLRVLFFGDADIFEKRISRMVRDSLERNPRLAVVCECRSARVERIVDRLELRDIEPIEYTVPYLVDSDIDAILAVLSQERRLGALKGMTEDQQRRVFRAEAGRQMLVAMYKATHGVDFREKAVDELRELEPTHRFLYAIVCVANAYRFNLYKDEIGIAFGDDIALWPSALDLLARRKLLLTGPDDSFKARHREIAQFIYSEVKTTGVISDVIRGLVKIAATKTGPNLSRQSRPMKLLRTFISHRLIKRDVGAEVGREIYGQFEAFLEWDHHYWLHRGALELESGNLGPAENFLLQARAIEPTDVFVDNEIAYLNLRKANQRPNDVGSDSLLRESFATLEAVVGRRPDQRAHAYHIMGREGLQWSRHAIMPIRDRQVFLEMLLQKVQEAMPDDVESMLFSLENDLRRELLSLAVT
ncbi:MAG: SIR2 family protein [Steroidobacteraceae bacterium]